MREIELDLDVEPARITADFVRLAEEYGVEFESGDVAKLGLYLAMLLRANESFNLTAIRDESEAWVRHIFDSLTLLPVVADAAQSAPSGDVEESEAGDDGDAEPSAEGRPISVIDVGSGGGLPGLPLAIAMPEVRFTLLEPTGKKIEFLRRAVEKLSLTNVKVVQERAERAAHDRGEKVSQGGRTSRAGGHREIYDLAIARAVGPLATIAELTVPFARVGGKVALIKGQKAEDELKEGEAALHLLKAVHAATVDTPTGKIVILEKSSATPKMYPRADGEPKRKPLGL